MMGRETKILLALLGTLSSGFVGVLGSKLFVPRPPDGAGPDVHLPASDHDAGPIVEPPSFDRLERSMFSATDLPADAPASGDAGDGGVEEGGPTGDLLATDENAAGGLLEPPSFWQDEASGEPPNTEPEDATPQDAEPTEQVAMPASPPFGAAASDSPGGGEEATFAEGSTDSPAMQPPAGFRETTPVAASPLSESPPAFAAVDDTAAVAASSFTSDPLGGQPLDPPGRFTPPPDAMPIASGSHVVSPGDSWWSIAERAYGDGRLYKPLFAWNRAIDPRVTLAAGTRLEVPPMNALATAHGALLPPDAALVASPPDAAVLQTSAVAPVASAGHTVVVREGDTLISIAREQLGASSRWRELYEANRATLGSSPGPLTAGTQLVLP